MKNALLFYLFIMLLSSGCVTSSNPPMTATQTRLPNPSTTVIQNAENLVAQNHMAQAEQLLNKYSKTWKTQAIRGDIAAYRGQWQRAAQFFQESFNLAKIAHPEPSYNEMKEIYSSFEDAQLLAGETVGSLIAPPPDPYKGYIVPPKMRVAVEFETDGWEVDEITQQGKRAIKRIANYLDANYVRQATLVGHTDERGPSEYNRKLSKKRAQSIYQYLSNMGTRTSINTDGKGEDEPLRPLPRWKKNWTPNEIYQRDRRVELIIE